MVSPDPRSQNPWSEPMQRGCCGPGSPGFISVGNEKQDGGCGTQQGKAGKELDRAEGIVGLIAI